jgi:arabinan endo-1,5-alpha-L-arabinosidase
MLNNFARTILIAATVAATFALAETPVFAQTSSAGSTPASAQETAWLAQLGSRHVRVHDPSTIVKCGDEYWLFYTGPGVASYHSKDLVKWERGPSVFTNAPAWTAQAVPANRWMYYWAPDVIHLGNRYLLYYAVSSFGKNRSAIGVATNPTLDPADPTFRWTDQGVVVQSTNTDNFNTIDPAVLQDANGKLWLAFGSYWSGIKLIQLSPDTGLRLEATGRQADRRIATNSPMYSIAFNDSIEASYIYRHDDFYYLFVNWGRCCRGTNSTYEIRMGRSKKITGPYLDRQGVDLMADGGTPFLSTAGPFIGPGHAGIFPQGGSDWLSCHFYDGTEAGRPTLAILPLGWGADGWPKVQLPPEK